MWCGAAARAPEGARAAATRRARRIGQLSALGLGLAAGLAHSAADLSGIRLPPGFRIEVWADGVANARSLAQGPGDVVYVSSMGAGNVYAIRSSATATATAAAPAPQPAARRVDTVLRGLSTPNGVAYHDGALYVAEIARVLRYRLDADGAPAGEPSVIATLPAERHHGWRFMAFGPDNRLYVAIGAPCNVCDKDADGFATIIRMNADGSDRQIVARGVRNSVGFTWHPRSGDLWFTDNGRDLMGDDVPACELNRLASGARSREGQHFGFPFCHGGDVVDPEFGKLGSCSSAVPPVQKLGPHVAPLGLKFYTGQQFPAEFRGSVFIAEHGSWNRSQRIGYRVTRVALKGNRAVAYEEFAGGWLDADGKVAGRPVDILMQRDGSMLVSDDVAGAVYRIWYESGRP